MNAQITNLDDVCKFITAGDALFTLVSKKTGERKTFLVEKAPPRNPGDRGFFVRLLVGPENTVDYRYLGFMYVKGLFLSWKLNKDNWGAEAGAAFAWLLSTINTPSPNLFHQAEVWHSGRCGKCGRTLTDPESIARGLGPKCAG